jgi:hypothetical protein
MTKTQFKQQMVDDDGNTMLIARKDNIIKLSLKLKEETRRRMIGFINTNTKVMYMARKRGKHLFRKMNAYGFCYRILADGKTFDKVRLKDETGEWLIPVNFLLDKENAKFLHFRGSGGFELQVFLSLDILEQFRRPVRF